MMFCGGSRRHESPVRRLLSVRQESLGEEEAM
jgi:hypothetical protein